MRKMKRVRTLAVAFVVGALSLSTLMSSASDFLATQEEPTTETAVEIPEETETEPETEAPEETTKETPAETTAKPEDPTSVEETTEGETTTEAEETAPAGETTEQPSQPAGTTEVIENEEGKIEVSYADTMVQVNQEEGILLPSLVEEVLNDLGDQNQVIVNLENKAQEVPSSLLQAAKGKDVVLTFYVAEGDYTFDIDAKAITDENSANGINLSVASYSAEADEQVQAMVPEDSTSVVYDFEHTGILPTTTVTVPTTGVFHENQQLYCYYVNEAENRLELVGDTFVIGGYASFTIEHCSKYILSDVKIDGAVTETEPSETTGGANETETAAGTNETAGETSGTTGSETAANNATAQSSATDSSSPSTGDTMNPIFYVGLAAFAAVLAVAAIKLLGRKPENRN